MFIKFYDWDGECGKAELKGDKIVATGRQAKVINDMVNNGFVLGKDGKPVDKSNKKELFLALPDYFAHSSQIQSSNIFFEIPK